jgi:regulator of protease activity HflC (stomatin/prohibitin superfamily)
MYLIQALNVLTVITWVTLIILVLISLVRRARLDGWGSALSSQLRWRNLLLLLLALSLTVLVRSLVFVKPQEVGVVVSLISANGYRDRPFRSGLHWLPPLLEEVHIYPIYWQTYTMSHTPLEGEKVGDDAIIARSSDGQQVAIDCSIIYQIIPDQSVRIHIEWQNRYQIDFVRAVSRGVVRNIVSDYEVTEINSEARQDIERKINEELRAIFQDKGFALDRFVLRNIAFSPEFAAAIERKQVEFEGVIRSQHEANQIREVAQGRADQVRFQAQADADAILMRAEAEAEALRLIATALRTSPDLLSYRYIDKIAPNIRIMLLPSDAPYILPLNQLEMEGMDGTWPLRPPEPNPQPALPTTPPETAPSPSPSPTVVPPQ